MRYNRHFRLNLIRWSFFTAVALTAFATGKSTAQRSDPVEDLRQALKVAVRDPMKNPDELEYRQRSLTKKAEAIQSIGDLRRALQLQEWRDEDRDTKVADVDKPIRALVAEKFEKAVRDVLQHGNPVGQMAAANLLGELGISVRGAGMNKGGAARPLGEDVAKLLDAKDSRVREAAARALGKINPDPDVAVPALGRVLAKDDLGQRRAAAAGLGNLVQNVAQIAKGKSVTGVEASRPELVKAATAVIPAAARGVDDSDAEVRRLAVEAVQLAAIALGDLVSDPRARLDFPPEDRKWSAEERLDAEEYGKQVEVERSELQPLATAFKEQAAALAKALKDRNAEVRVAARRALEEVGNARRKLARRANSVPKIPADAGMSRARNPGALLASRSVGHKTGVAETVSSKNALRATLVVLQDKPRGEKMDDPLLDLMKTDLPALLAGVGDPDVRVRLATIGVVEMLDEDAALAVPALVKALKDPDRFVRWSAARVLGKASPVEADRTVPNLARLLNDPDYDLRLATINTLEHYGPAAKDALPALTRTIATGDVEIRRAAIKAVESMGSRVAHPAVPALIAALDDPDVRIRRAAAETLGRFGATARAAEPALRRNLDSADPEERRAASEALLNIMYPGK